MDEILQGNNAEKEADLESKWKEKRNLHGYQDSANTGHVQEH